MRWIQVAAVVGLAGLAGCGGDDGGGCPDDPVPTGDPGACPGECTGGCAGGVCTIDCSAGACVAGPIVCPDDYACEVACDGLDACDSNTITCPAENACTVRCTGGIDSCGDLGLECGSGSCSIECGEDMCTGGAVTCGAGACTASCSGAPGPAVECGDACSCSECSSATRVDGGGGGGVSYDDVAGWVDDYKAAHPGNGGKDWDINTKTPEEVAADPDAQQLLAICGGDDQRPVIPLLAWEYGGADHQWIDPEASALVYCDYIPVSPNTAHWSYTAAEMHVVADLYVLFPEENPCKDMVGADQVAGCIGDPSNFEILVDIANLDDGIHAGLELSEASTELKLIPPGGGPSIHLHDDL